MRKLTVVVVIAALLYAGYWVLGRGQIETRLTNALTEIDAGPYDVQYSDLSTTGFPSRFDTTITDLVLSDPVTDVTWTAPFFQIFALSYRPNEVIAHFAPEQVVTANGQDYTLFTADMRASGKVAANTALTFQTATFSLDNPRLRDGAGSELAMASLLAAMRLTPNTDKTYDLFVDAQGIVLPQYIQRLLDPQGRQPPVMRRVQLDARIDLTAPLALNAGDDPIVSRVSLTELAFDWGTVSLSGIGEAAPDATGLLQGSLTVTARNWQTFIDLAIDNGMLSSNQRLLWMEILGNLDATPQINDTLTLTIDITDGVVRLGGFMVTTLPRL